MKKRIICSLLAVVFSVGILATFAFAAETGTGHYYKHRITATSVHLRSGPSTSYPSYGLIYYDEIFWCQLDERDHDGYSYGHPDWDTALTQAYGYEVSGYVSNQYLLYDDPLSVDIEEVY